MKGEGDNEADAMVQTAKSTLAEAEIRAAEILRQSQQDADQLITQAHARHEQLITAEHELNRRLESAEAAFRSLRAAAHPNDTGVPVAGA